MRRLLFLPIVFAAAACTADDPPVVADHASPRYRAELAACRAEGAKVADTDVKKRGPLFVTYPISFTVLHSRETAKCLERRGYHLPPE